MDEVFDLQERNQWLRRQIVAVLRQLIKAMFGKLISRNFALWKQKIILLFFNFQETLWIVKLLIISLKWLLQIELALILNLWNKVYGLMGKCEDIVYFKIFKSENSALNLNIPFALCSRNFQNVKLRHDFVKIWSFYRHSNFKWNQILVNSNSPKVSFLEISESFILNFW